MVVGHYPNKRRNALTPAVSVSSAALDQESCESDPETRVYRSFGHFCHCIFLNYNSTDLDIWITNLLRDQGGNGSGSGDQLGANDDFLPQPDLEENAEIGGGARKIFSVGSVPNFDVTTARIKGYILLAQTCRSFAFDFVVRYFTL